MVVIGKKFVQTLKPATKIEESYYRITYEAYKTRSNVKVIILRYIFYFLIRFGVILTIRYLLLDIKYKFIFTAYSFNKSDD